MRLRTKRIVSGRGQAAGAIDKRTLVFLALIAGAAVALSLFFVNPSTENGESRSNPAGDSHVSVTSSEVNSEANSTASFDRNAEDSAKKVPAAEEGEGKDAHTSAEVDVAADTDSPQQPSAADRDKQPSTTDSAASAVREEGVLITSGPAAGRRLRIPDPAEYVAQLPAPVRERLDTFHQKYPDVDPTDGNAFGQALMTERGQHPIELSSEQYDTHYAWLAKTKAMSEQMIEARGRLLGIPLNGTDNEGRGYLLAGFDGAKPRYTFTQNREAATSTAAKFVRRNAAFDSVFGPNVDGSGFYVNVMDAGLIHSHLEFRNDADTDYRLTAVETGSVHSHATYVAGTIGARGADARAMGMAPAVHMYSMRNNDGIEYGMNWPGRPERSIVGNTSLSWPSGDNGGTYRFPATALDQSLYDTPYYLSFVSAGNEGSAYFTIAEGDQTAKNTVTVGSVSDASRDANGIRTGGANISSWSSRGPMRDGRIKPDIVANGQGLYTTDRTTGYTSKSGTSLSCPNATGSAVLLQDYFNKRFPGRYMRAPTLKALIINTAEDRGNPGPDYHYGWGLMNVLEAGRIIKKYAANPASRVLVEDTLTEGQTISTSYTYDGSGPIRVTISWYDLPGPGTSDPANTTPVLVNDLNLRLIAPDSSAHLPYVMPYVIGSGTTPPFDPSLRGANAVTGTNFTDNSIQVLIAAPQAGEYTVEISHAGTLTGGSQKYSLVVSGMTAGAAPPPVITSNTTQGYTTDELPIEVMGTGFMLGAEVTLKRDGSQPVRPYGVEVSEGRIFARLDTSSMAKGYWDVVVRNPDGQEAVSATPLLLPVRQTLYSNNFNNASGLTLEGGWAVGPPNQSAVGGPGSAYSAPNVLGTYLNGNYPNNLSRINAKLPAISTLNMKNIKVNFRQWLGKKASDKVYIWSSRNGFSFSANQIARDTDIDENNWSLQSHALSSIHDNQATVYIRFSLESDAADVSYGMNIDDLEVTGEGSDKVPPVFTSEAVTSAVAAEAYTYSVSVSDGDTAGSGLSWTGGTLPGWLTLQPTGDGTTAALSGTPAATDVGDHDVALRVTDGDYVTWQTFTIRVSPEGHVPGMPVLVHLTPQDLRSQSATLRADVLEGDLPLQVSLLWGITDGGTDPAAWANSTPLGDKPLGEIAVPLADLSTGATYYYRFSATNDVATGWAPESGVLQLPMPPIVDAGPDQTVQSSEPVAWTLDGSASDPADAPLTITWSLVSGPAAVTFADPSDPKTTITFTEFGIHVLRLTADNGADTTHDEVTITVGPPNGLVADAGPDQTVIDTNHSGSASVTLDGSASFDLNNTIVSYIWNDGTSEIATGESPTISLPLGMHTITLTVTNNDGITDSDSVAIIVRSPISASGGTVELVGDYYVHTFTGGTAAFEVFDGITLDVDVLVVGGGGGGGSSTGFNTAGGGGGGAGGLIYQEGIQVTGSVGVVVGTPGAAAGSGNTPGNNGGNSEFGSLVALGGGGGSGGNMQGRAGGSGGGSRGNSNGGAGQQPTSISGGFGNSGGGWPDSGGDGAGGGGGAGAPAASSPPHSPGVGGPGGSGRSYDISGEPVYYAGGGGGGGSGTSAFGQGGNGGGGNGGNNNNNPTAGATNTGGGGGGGNNNRVGAPGGSGIVIVRYLAAIVKDGEYAFNQWATNGDGEEGITFTGDSNADGVADGMSWLLGADDPSHNANGLLPQAAETTGNLVLTFKMLNSSSRGTAILRLERSRDLGVTDPWTENVITIPDTSGTVDGVVFDVTPIDGTDHNQVTATIPASAAAGTGKLFVRLSGALSP